MMVMGRRVAYIKSIVPEFSVLGLDFPDGVTLYYACTIPHAGRREDATRLSDFQSYEKMISWLEGFAKGVNHDKTGKS